MMRNVAIGAVLGFGLMVLLLSVFNTTPPPAAPPPAVDAGAAIVPMNVAPVVVLPPLSRVRPQGATRGFVPEVPVVPPSEGGADADAGR
jgi:hypothetical protein